MSQSSASDWASERRTGGCFCGAARYVAVGPPINVRVCHCQDCQRLTGTAFFARALYAADAVFVTGLLAGYKSSDDLIRKFCPRCGSQLFAQRLSKSTIGIGLGSFDDANGLRPSEHIWVSDKQEWLNIWGIKTHHSQSAPK
jgi:hypothetical protein